MKTISELGRTAQAQVISEMKAGTFSPMSWAAGFDTGEVTIKEMIGTSDGAAEFVEKVTYDLQQSRNAVPNAYGAIYSTKTDPNFPLVLTEKGFGLAQSVFLEKFEGGEVKFGSLGPSIEQTVRFHTWATGFEYDEDMVEYNQTWRVSDLSAAMGDAYQRLLNNLHMSPIVTGTFSNANATNPQAAKVAQWGNQSTNTAGVAQAVTANGGTFIDALQAAYTVLPDASIILCNSSDNLAVQEALAADMLADYTPGVLKKTFTMENVLNWDGDTIQVGDDVYTYQGVTPGTFYLIVPKRQFIEYIKHDLRVDGNDGDLTRLVVTQLVGRARRAVLAILGGRYGVVKFTVS